MARFLPLALGFVLLAQAASELAAAPKVGDTFRIVRTQEAESEGPEGSTGSSFDRDALIERIAAVRADGSLELAYDLPKESGDRTSQWQFPVRVLKPATGQLQLLNRAELEGRRDRWLKTAKIPREACGHWIFTWNAFQIECDPETAIRDIETFDIISRRIAKGASYSEPGTLGSVALATTGPERTDLTAELPIDPESIRHSNAESDVVVGEISRKPVTLEAALRDHQADVVTGTVKITFERDPAGDVYRRTKVTKVTVKAGDKSETRTVTETIERQRL